MQKLTFESWLKKIDSLLDLRWGLSHLDLPDHCYRDSYDNDLRPIDVIEDLEVDCINFSEE